MAQEQFSNLAQTTLNGAINNSVTSLVVASATGFPTSGQYRIIIDNEILIVTAGAGTTTWTVTRGAEGTTAVSHADKAPVTQVLTALAVTNIVQGQCGTRLTYTQGTPVTTTDVTAATSIFLEPAGGGNVVTVYDGSQWRPVAIPGSTYALKLTNSAQTGTMINGQKTITGLTSTGQLVVGMQVTGTSIAGSSTIASIDSATQVTMNNNATGGTTNSVTFKLPASTLYNVYLVWNGGTPRLQFGAASGETLTLGQDGIYTNNATIGGTNNNNIAANLGRYLGNIYTSGTTGQGTDSTTNRLLANWYNRVLKNCESTDSSDRTNTNVLAQVGSVQISFVSPLGLDFVRIEGHTEGYMTASAGAGYVGIGSTNSALASGCVPGPIANSNIGPTVLTTLVTASPAGINTYYLLFASDSGAHTAHCSGNTQGLVNNGTVLRAQVMC